MRIGSPDLLGFKRHAGASRGLLTPFSPRTNAPSFPEPEKEERCTAFTASRAIAAGRREDRLSLCRHPPCPAAPLRRGSFEARGWAARSAPSTSRRFATTLCCLQRTSWRRGCPAPKQPRPPKRARWWCSRNPSTTASGFRRETSLLVSYLSSVSNRITWRPTPSSSLPPSSSCARGSSGLNPAWTYGASCSSSSNSP